MTVSQATPTTVHLPQLLGSSHSGTRHQATGQIDTTSHSSALPAGDAHDQHDQHDPHNPLLRPEGRVLSTLNPDGSRRWLEPKLSNGRFLQRRRIVAWILIIVFAAIPWIRINDKPVILLDVMTRKFVFFGTTFRPTDTLLLALLLLSIFVGIFLLTALFGRVWCGWACPQTVYMEFLYRPVERLFLGKAYGNRKASVAPWRRVAMYAVFLLASAHLANTFLAYFVGTDRLVEWTLRSPTEHPTAFAIFVVTTGLMMFDFCFFREQMCTLVCPYGRFQSVLLDKGSLIVGAALPARALRTRRPSRRPWATASTARSACRPARPASTSATVFSSSAFTAPSASTHVTRSWTRSESRVASFATRARMSLRGTRRESFGCASSHIRCCWPRFFPRSSRS
jgi:hypothetical protein